MKFAAIHSLHVDFSFFEVGTRGSSWGNRNIERERKGVFLVKKKNTFIPVKRVYSVNTYFRISIVSRGSE